MIYSVSGLLKTVQPGFCVIEACGIGYQLTCSTNTLTTLPSKGGEVELLTVLVVREDGVELFGFGTEGERKAFQMLTSVSGVGPKAALSILSSTGPDRLMMSIAAGDVKSITMAQGVGPKLAQRIILECKDKVAKMDLSGNAGELQTIVNTANTPSNAKGEAVSALIALGYNQTDAATVIAPMDDTLPVDELVRMALKSFLKNR